MQTNPLGTTYEGLSNSKYPIPENLLHASRQLQHFARVALRNINDKTQFIESEGFLTFLTELQQTDGIDLLSCGREGDHVVLHYRISNPNKRGDFKSVITKYPLIIAYKDVDGKRHYTAQIKFEEIDREES